MGLGETLQMSTDRMLELYTVETSSWLFALSMKTWRGLGVAQRESKVLDSNTEGKTKVLYQTVLKTCLSGFRVQGVLELVPRQDWRGAGLSSQEPSCVCRRAGSLEKP